MSLLTEWMIGTVNASPDLQKELEGFGISSLREHFEELGAEDAEEQAFHLSNDLDIFIGHLLHDDSLSLYCRIGDEFEHAETKKRYQLLSFVAGIHDDKSGIARFLMLNGESRKYVEDLSWRDLIPVHRVWAPEAFTVCDVASMCDNEGIWDAIHVMHVTQLGVTGRPLSCPWFEMHYAFGEYQFRPEEPKPIVEPLPQEVIDLAEAAGISIKEASRIIELGYHL